MVSVAQLRQWNNISGHLIYPNQTIIVKQTIGNNKGDTTVVGGVNQAVQNVMNRYKGQSAYAYFESLTDGQTAGMYQNSLMYGASVPKVVLMAYTQDLIERGLYLGIRNGGIRMLFITILNLIDGVVQGQSNMRILEVNLIR